jgi:choline dehydrogenase-like flavoprotein
MNGANDGRYGLIVTAHTEQAPDPDSRIVLADGRDRLGRQEVRLDWRVSDLDLWTIRRATEVLAREVQRAGLGQVQIRLDGQQWQRSPALRGGFHHMGTTRMHSSPAQGVTDADGRVHGVANLFVASSAVFPTAGYANPTLTIVALAIRLADHIKQALASNRLR